MQLTRFQRRALAVYWWYRQHPPAWRFYLSAMLWRSSYLIYLGVVGVAIALVLLGRSAASGRWVYLALGVIAGMVIRALLAYQQTIRLWPLLERIIDWEQVDVLLHTQPAQHTEGGDPSE